MKRICQKCVTALSTSKNDIEKNEHFGKLQALFYIIIFLPKFDAITFLYQKRKRIAFSTSNERNCYNFTLSQEVSVIDMGVLGEIGAEAETTP